MHLNRSLTKLNTKGVIPPFLHPALFHSATQDTFTIVHLAFITQYQSCNFKLYKCVIFFFNFKFKLYGKDADNRRSHQSYSIIWC